MIIDLTPRQEKITEIVKSQGPITGEQIAELLSVTRAALRSDLAILVMSGYIEARPRVGYYYLGKVAESPCVQEIRRMLVRDVQSVPVVVGENTSVYETIVTMFLEDIGTLTVVQEGGLLAGVVSRKDLLRAALGNADLQKIPVSIIMTRMPNVVFTTPEESLYEAAKKIIEREVDALPVVKPHPGGHGKYAAYEVIGRLTKTNLTKVLVELGSSTDGRR